MRLFHCDRCAQIVPFSAHRCPACDTSLGYVTEDRTTLRPATFSYHEVWHPFTIAAAGLHFATIYTLAP